MAHPVASHRPYANYTLEALTRRLNAIGPYKAFSMTSITSPVRQTKDRPGRHAHGIKDIGKTLLHDG